VTTSTIARGPETTAAQVRSRLTGILQEHVYLAAAAAASRGRADEQAAAQSALAGNAKALSDNLTSLFTGNDADAAKQISALWTAGVAQNAGDIASQFNRALPALPPEAVSGPLSAAEQAIGGGTNFTALRGAAAQMVTLGASLAGAIHQKYPDRIGGDPASKASDLLTALNAGLQEHAFLASAATNAALGGRADEFTSAKTALDANSDALTGVIGGIYGPDGGKAFAPLWKQHIDFLVDYTTAVGAKDQPKADKAMADLLAYTEAFGAFINTASPKLTKDAVAELIKTHVFTLKDVIDAQAAKEFDKAYVFERTAADHMTMIASNLAITVVAQFPKNY
jgi:hypothetical protein